MSRTKKLFGHKGFTLIELLVSAGLSSFILVAVLTTALMLGRMGANVQNYTEIESKARRALEMFSREARLAYAMDNGTTTAVSPLSTTQIRFYIPDSNSTNRIGTGTGSYTVIYTFSGSSLTRYGPPISDPSGTYATTTLLTNIQQISGSSYLNFYKYINSNYNYIILNPSTANATTYREAQQVEMNFVVTRTSTTVTKATNKVLSARFILRNK